MDLFPDYHRKYVGDSPVPVPVRSHDACRVHCGLIMELAAGNQNGLVL
jgi:hypothetical protein